MQKYKKIIYLNEKIGVFCIFALSNLKMKKLPDTLPLRIVFGVLAYLLLIPFVFITFRYIPNAHWPWNLDRILLFLALVALITFVLRKRKIIVAVSSVSPRNGGRESLRLIP